MSEELKLQAAAKEEAKSPVAGGLEGKLTRLEQLMAALVVVLFIGFAAVFVAATSMLVDSWRSKQASYQQLELQVQELNSKIGTLKSVR